MIFIYMAMLMASPAPAPAAEITRAYDFRDRKIEFAESERDNALLSTGCRKKDGTFACAALKNLAKLSWKKVQHDHPGTEATGSILCEETLRGIVVVGMSELGDENAFCRFTNDESLVELGSLEARARRNDSAAGKAVKK